MGNRPDLVNALLLDGTTIITAATAAATYAPLASPVLTGLPQLPSYVKTALPSATAVGQVIYVSNATGAHKTGSLAFAIATGTGSWVDVTTGTFVA